MLSMPRPLRIQFHDAWYHVMNRGAGRRLIFHSDEHRQLFLELLEEASQKFGLEIHAYCLMDNHYHLLLRTPLGNLSRVMRHINGIYTQRYNNLQKTDGPLFRGRYKAILVEEDSYLLMASRYIHLNPVDAGIVKKAEDYKWSSYNAYIASEKKPDWLITDSIIEQISSRKSLTHISGYKAYVESTDLNEINTFYSQKYTSPILGSDTFVTKMLSTITDEHKIASSSDVRRAIVIPSIEEITREVGEYYQLTKSELLKSRRGQANWPKQVALYICKEKYGYSLVKIANNFPPIGHITVGTAVHKCKQRLLEEPILLHKIEAIIMGIENKYAQGCT